jgi:hypothetical protein
LGVFTALLLLSSIASAGPSIPSVGQPTTGFYNASGTNVKVSAAAEPTTLSTDQWLRLSLTITSLIDPSSVEKPALTALRQFNGFQIREGGELDPPIDPARPSERVFVYRLRPLSTATESIPELEFFYFDPRRVVAPDRPRDRFPRTYSNAIAIRVTPAAIASPAATAKLEVPAFARNLSPPPRSDDQRSIQETLALVAWRGGPILAILAFILARWLFPDEAKKARLRRHRATRQALATLDQLRSDGRAADADGVRQTLNTYLEARHGMPRRLATPTEVAGFFEKRNSALAMKLRELLNRLDEQRFRPGAPDDPLIDDAIAIIVELEERA